MGARYRSSLKLHMHPSTCWLQFFLQQPADWSSCRKGITRQPEICIFGVIQLLDAYVEVALDSVSIWSDCIQQIVQQWLCKTQCTDVIVEIDFSQEEDKSFNHLWC